MARWNASDLTLVLERAIFGQSWWEGCLPRLNDAVLSVGRRIEADELLRGGPVEPSGRPNLDLLERRQRYVRQLREVSNWQTEHRAFLKRLPIEARETFERLVQLGAIPYVLAEELERFLRVTQRPENSAGLDHRTLKARHDLQVASCVDGAASLLLTLCWSPPPKELQRMAALSADMKRYAKLIDSRARSRLHLTPKRAETDVCLNIGNHLAIMTSGYHDTIVGQLFDAIAPLHGNKARDPKALAKRRRDNRRHVVLPGDWIVHLYPKLKTPQLRANFG